MNTKPLAPTRIGAALCAALLIQGCATTGAGYVPIVDMQGHDHAAFASDLNDCQQYAKQTMSSADQALVGAVIGGLLGAFLAPSGDRNYFAGRMAVIGGASAGTQGTLNRQQIIKRCMAGRGYNVLN